MLFVVFAACVAELPPAEPEPVCEPVAVTGDCLLWRCYRSDEGAVTLWHEGPNGDRYACEDYACLDGYAEAALAECGVVDSPDDVCYPLPVECGVDVACSVCYEPGDFTAAARYECSDGWDRGIASWTDQAAAAQDLVCHCDPAACVTDTGADGTGDTGL